MPKQVQESLGTIKHWASTIMNASAVLAFLWLLCLQYVCVLLNYMASPVLGGICPIQVLNGQTPDISFLQYFTFFEPAYYHIDHNDPDYVFPSASIEKKGYWATFADNVGDTDTRISSL